MAQEPDFREPVFVRNDDTTNVRASVVDWGDKFDGLLSVKLTNGGGESVLINVADWEAVKSSVDAELNRVGA